MKKIKALGMGALVVGSFGLSVAFAAETRKVMDVQSVQAAIAASKAGWQAKDNWVNNLSKAEITRMMGLLEPPKGSLDFQSVGVKNAKGGALDWRNKDGTSWLSPVMN